MSEQQEVVLVLDLETTSGTVADAKIVQIGAVLLSVDGPFGQWSPVPIFSTLANPQIHIPEEASNVHHILDEQVQYAPPEAWAVFGLQSVIRQLKSHYDVVLAGHNLLNYDLRILEKHFSAYANLISHLPVIDTFNWARRQFPTAENHQLGGTYYAITGKAPTDAHDAVADCLMVGEMLFHHLTTTGQSAYQMATELARPQAFTVMPFGKHKGKPINHVPKSYMHFMLTTFTDMSPDLEYTVKKALGIAQ